MARPLRLSFDGAVYHITARGNRKDKIFHDHEDRQVFLKKMNETFNKYSFNCYAYCLMANHYHLYIKTNYANLSEGMHYLNTSYANWFKAKYNLIGVVFQGRYKSILVDENSYSLQLSAYIHLNALRAGVEKNIKDFKWSSYLDYMGRRKTLDRLDIEFILKQFDNGSKQASKRYHNYILGNAGLKIPFEDAYKGVALGSKQYIKRIRGKIKKIGENREIVETKHIEVKSIEKIVNKIKKIFNIESNEIFEKRRGNIYRQLTMYLIKKYTDLTLRDIGNLFDMDYAAISQACTRFEERMRTERKLWLMTERVRKQL